MKLTSDRQLPKRMTYLERRHDLSTAEFRAHWATTHARIAVDLPGVLSYQQNHVLAESRAIDANADSSSAAHFRFHVDGIVELCFINEQVASAGFGSAVADRLIADELHFLSGLTGAAVVTHGPPSPWPYKLWLLATPREQAADGGETEVAASVDISVWAATREVELGALGHQVNLLDERAPVLQRTALRREPRLPAVAISFGFKTRPRAEAAAELIAGAEMDLGVAQAQVFETETKRVI